MRPYINNKGANTILNWHQNWSKLNAKEFPMILQKIKGFQYLVWLKVNYQQHIDWCFLTLVQADWRSKEITTYHRSQSHQWMSRSLSTQLMPDIFQHLFIAKKGVEECKNKVIFKSIPQLHFSRNAKSLFCFSIWMFALYFLSGILN